MEPRNNWALYDGEGKVVEEFKYFHDAVEKLAKADPGEWAANWSRWELIKGRHYVTTIN